MAFSTSANSATISTNEYFLFANSTSASYQTTDAYLYGLIDFSNMIAGDSYRVRVYEKINGSSARTVLDATLSGAQSTAYEIAERIMTEGYEISVTRTAGSDRSIGWSLRTDTGTDISSLATAAAVAALPSASTIATAVLAATIHTGWSLARAVRIIGAAVAGKVSGTSGTAPIFRFLDDSGDAITGTTSTNDRTAATYGA